MFDVNGFVESLSGLFSTQGIAGAVLSAVLGGCLGTV